MNCNLAWIVSDDEPLAEELDTVLRQHCNCESVRQAHCCGVEGADQAPNWIFVDLRNGHRWDEVQAIHDFGEDRFSKPVAMIGILQEGFPLQQCLVASHRLDAWTFDPLCVDHLRGLIDRLPSRNSMRRGSPGTASPSRILETKNHRFETHTPALCDLIDNLEMVSARDFTVLLVGETGTGKTTLARILHDLSGRRDKPFVNVACGALPSELIDSELFGHLKGAFTSADSTTEGKFAAAKDGTILLDEIDVLGLGQQTKLLRVLESGEFERIGSNETSRVKARMIIATNVDLELLIQRKEFRQDLYFRLNQVKFEIPPLRNRPADIVPLALHFVDECCREEDLVIRRVHPEFLSALQAYSWPGNIRELRNEVSRAVIFAKKGVLTRDDLSPMIVACGRDSEGNGRTSVGLAAQVACTEQAAIEKMLQVNNFNRAATARALGISRVTLYNKLRKYRIRVESLQNRDGE
jgi:DNA-binding NtrC family response regulator